MKDLKQLSLRFEFRPAYGDEDFLVTASNRDAVAWVDRWPNWPSLCLIIYGPSGCGKTHLTEVFRRRADARFLYHSELSQNLPRDPRLTNGAWIIEDVDLFLKNGIGTPLFHLFNQINEGGGTLLINARTAPARWSIDLEDLRSRINASQAVAIQPPDDQLLAAVLLKLFADRQIRVDVDVVSYAVTRMERSFLAIRELVDRLDQLSLISRREITVPLVRQVLNTCSEENI